MSATDRSPVLFVGHGSPMNAVDDNKWTRGFQALGRQLQRPRAILCVSAHWYVDGIYLTGSPAPETIHDFGGFPGELYEIEYPAPGDPSLAQKARKLISEETARIDEQRGLDHGAWTVFEHMVPDAKIPIVQLSIDRRLPPRRHIELGRTLAPLREEEVLIVGSGNMTHNLRHAMRYVFGDDAVPETPGWAQRFDRDAMTALQQHDDRFLSGALQTDDGRMSHPTPDHYLPLLYAYGAATDSESVSSPWTGFDASSLSMRSVLFG